MLTTLALARWRANPVEFIEQVLVDPETGKPFVLLDAERWFLKFAFTTDENGRLLYPELIYGAIKKSGKTGFAALFVITILLLYGGRYAEAYVIANDLEQAQSRVFEMCRRIVEASPLLRSEARITANRIIFEVTGATIQALASDYASAAGGHPTISVFDELWGYTSERSRRLWDEMIPVPTRKISCRLVVSYAGFEEESELLHSLYKRGSAQPLVDRFVTTESTFIDLAWWDQCVDPALTPGVIDRSLPIWVGVDASVKRDSTAIVAVTWDYDKQKVRLVAHKVFQPSPDEPLDVEIAVEHTLLALHSRFDLRLALFDPYQMQASAQRLQREGIEIEEFPQSVPNLTEASQNLFDLIKSRNLVVYPDANMRLAVSRAVAVETQRGWRISKDKQSHKIDVVVALSMAALGAIKAQEDFYEPFGRLVDDPTRPKEDRETRTQSRGLGIPMITWY
jgi:phage terminase large subunit-like protein